jgi:hypothetical protein
MIHFFCIFAEDGDLFSACYPEDGVEGRRVDIFSKLFDQWSDTEYLKIFFVAHKDELASPYWKGMTIDQAIDRVLDERQMFEYELWAIETRQLGYENKSIKDVFQKLHVSLVSLNWSGEMHRKARPNVPDSMLRIYGIELPDGTIVITGGAIKLTETMAGEQFDAVRSQLERVQRFLLNEKIVSKEGLETT